MIAFEETLLKLQRLSPERAERVLGLINDLAELQTLEDRQDLEDARASLAEPGENVPWTQLREQLDVLYSHRPASGT